MSADHTTFASDIHVDFRDIENVDALATAWQDLETRASHSFFQSWQWIGCWLTTLPPECQPQLLEARRDGRTVALALLVQASQRRSGFVRSNGLFLHETGHRDIDQLTIEHNGFLTEDQDRSSIIEACLRHLVEAQPAWDELNLSGVADDYQARSRGTALSVEVLASKPSDYVDLSHVRRSGGNYIGLLSRNSRYQIRRSLRKYGDFGPIDIAVASSRDEAIQFFEELKHFHQYYWNKRGQAGSFSFPFFEKFHKSLIFSCFDASAIQLMRIMAGSEPIGFLYNFVQDGRIYNYQSGFNYKQDNHFKPGLVSHYLAIQHNLDLGHTIYDFLPGEARYKRSLGTHSAGYVWLRLKRDRWFFTLEAWLRALERRLERRQAGNE